MGQYGIDQRYRGSGITMPGIAGETVPRGAAVYMSAADGLWYLADSDAAATMPAVGIVSDAGIAGNVIQILVFGLIERSDWTWTRGDPLYISGTAGVLTQTAPATNTQAIGVAITATMIQVDVKNAAGIGSATGCALLEGATAYVGFDSCKEPFTNYFLCDGTADDVQIQAAIDYVNTLGGGRVVLDEGTFTIIASITFYDDICLEGQGQRSTILHTTTNALDMLQIHGAAVGTKLNGVRIANLRLTSNATATSDGVSVRYCAGGIFENIQISGFNGHGVHIQGSHDNFWSNIYVTGCGHTVNTLAAVYLENLADQDVNSEHFLNLQVEPWRYRALYIGADNGNYIAHLNRFISSKFHGDETTTAIVIDGHSNIFTNTDVENVGAAVTGIQIGASGAFNSFYETHIGVDVGLAFDVDGSNNIIDGVDGDGGSSKLIAQGFDISGNENLISNVAFVQLHEWAFTISGNNNHFNNIDLNPIDEEGFIISGNENVLTACSPLWVGVDAGEACAVTGDENQIFGGKFNGPGTKTITFAGGADNNRVVASQVTKAITDAGAGNQFWRVQNYDTENNVLSPAFAIDAVAVVAVVIAHGLDVTPAVEDCQLTVIEDTNVDDWEEGFVKVESTDGANVYCKVNVTNASATGGATAKLSLRVIAL